MIKLGAHNRGAFYKIVHKKIKRFFLLGFQTNLDDFFVISMSNSAYKDKFKMNCLEKFAFNKKFFLFFSNG